MRIRTVAGAAALSLCVLAPATVAEAQTTPPTTEDSVSVDSVVEGALPGDQDSDNTGLWGLLGLLGLLGLAGLAGRKRGGSDVSLNPRTTSSPPRGATTPDD